MKRLCLLMLVVVFLVGSVSSALALDFELSKLSDAEVIELVEQLTVELASREIEKTASLLRGDYVVGRDIPAGKYTFTYPATEEGYAYVEVIAQGVEKPILAFSIEAGNTHYLNLEEGNILNVDESFQLTIMPGIVFK